MTTRIKTGELMAHNGHLVAYTQTSHVGYFDTIDNTETAYVCECGKYTHTSKRALKAEALKHDSWNDASQKGQLLAELKELMSVN